ncbi:MAG: NAD(P)/FAD-dependent oxidoreductase [Nitrospirae bacterium]|nr:NAD(P)/FAD-dependent oxidoreductase [Nitrospirota bacterium]
MKIAIIGSGIAGLAAAYELSKSSDAEISIFEKDHVLGGLASSFDFGGAQLEKYYHFICGCDDDLLDLIKELGIENRLRWKHNKQSIFYNGKSYNFSTPLDLLKFKPLSFINRLKSGLALKSAITSKDWERFEGITAVTWLKNLVGEEAYNIIWHPLLKVKFGPYYDKISAPWIWHRIHRVASSRKNLLSKEMIAYIEGGTKILVDNLEEHLLKQGVNIHRRRSVEKIIIKNNKAQGIIVDNEKLFFDKVISTVALPLLDELLPDNADKLKKQIQRISFIGVVCVVLKLKHDITDTFWLNINDSNFTYNGIITYTNLNPSPQFKGNKIAYIPYYVSAEDPLFKYPTQELFNRTIKPLPLINRHFSLDWVVDYKVFRDKYAQPISTVDFSKNIIPTRSPVENLYISDSSQLYPMDRCLSGMIGLSKQITKDILSK